ncbi:aprataxin and PNK-like factor [Discoglossus pictus]
MAGFQLEAMDGSGATTLPKGETVIGRGPFLGIADKRVSRSHALLEVVDDKLRIKPVHVNPCFYQEAKENKFLPLERNEWHWLKSGDCISLLPDTYAFRIIATHSVQEILRDSEDLVKGALSNEAVRFTSASETQKSFEKPSCSASDTSKKVLQSTQSAHATTQAASPPANCKEYVEKANSSQRKRVLPDWMMQGDLKIQSLSCPANKAGSNAKKRAIREKILATSNVEESLPGRKRLLSPDDTDEQERGCVKKRNIKPTLQSEVSAGMSIDHSQSKTQVENVSVNAKRNSQDDDVMEVENNETVIGINLQHTENENVQKNNETECQSAIHSNPSETANEDDLSESPEAETSSGKAGYPQSAVQTPKKRTQCVYAERCYRKNPAHFQEFCHPGDSDYCDAENGSQDDSDDRPECPYGTDCYRKNPQHKLEYKHTKSPGKGGRRLRRRPAKKGKSVLDGDSDNDGESNEYDLDDSFIDDDEEDFDFTDEDSDWMPDSEDKDTEDMKTLIKEAKKFTKGKN